MTIGECALSACKLLQLDEAATEIENAVLIDNADASGNNTASANGNGASGNNAASDNTDNADASANDGLSEDAQLIIDCVKSTVEEIADEFIPLMRVATATAVDREIVLSDLDENVNRVFSVKSGERERAFKCRYDRLIVPQDGEYAVAFSVAPTFGTLNDDICYTHSLISTRIIAFGVARDFCIITGRTDEANVWEQRFKAALESKLSTKKFIKLKRRGWY